MNYRHNCRNHEFLETFSFFFTTNSIELEYIKRLKSIFTLVLVGKYVQMLNIPRRKNR